MWYDIGMEIIDGAIYVPLEEALQVAKAVAERLRTHYGATRVILFGSVVEGFYVPGHSDIDIYFELPEGEDEWQVTAKLMMEFSDYDIDFRPIGECTPRFRDAVLRKGKEI